jgi:thioredoxin 2
MAEATAVQCPACKAINRVPVDKIKRGKKAVCGRCATPLPIPTAPMTVTDATFAADVERSPLPVLVDMWAPWCGPCHAVAPMIDELAAEMTGRVRFAKMNVDDNPTTASRFAVRSIPTLLLLKDGREVDRIVGVPPRSELAARLERVLVPTASAGPPS